MMSKRVETLTIFNDLIASFIDRYPVEPGDHPGNTSGWLSRMDNTIRDHGVTTIAPEGFIVSILGTSEYRQGAPALLSVTDIRGSSPKQFVFVGISEDDGYVTYHSVPVTM